VKDSRRNSLYHPQARSGSRNGSILFVMMAALAALATIASTAYLVTRMDLKISGNYKDSAAAFNNADAGVQYVKSQLENAVAAGTIAWGTSSNLSVNVSAPSGYQFDSVTSLRRLANTNAYLYTVTGRFRDARTMIEAVVYRVPFLQYGVFGNTVVDMKSNGSVYSYYSSEISAPVAADSDGRGDTASNTEVITHNDTLIDGTLALGESSYGDPAVWHSTGTPKISGEEGLEVNHIDSDPLGAIGGQVATEIVAAESSNNNAGVTPEITSPQYQINLGNSDTMTLTAGTYYVEDITLGNGAILDVDASSGPVKIYLGGNGSIEAKMGSTINITGAPTDFFIYSDTTGSIILKNSGHLEGLIYAPYGRIEIKNSGDFFGVAWADEIDIKNSGELFVDRSLTDSLLSDKLTLASWLNVRN